MDPNSLLLWTVFVSSALVLARGLTGAVSPLRTGMVFGLVLLAVAVFAVMPNWAGYVAGSVWFLLLVLPGVGLGTINRLLSVHRFRAAHSLAQILAWVHPIDGFRHYPQLILALEHLRWGRFEEGRNALAELAQWQGQCGWTARVLLTRLTCDWPAFMDRVDTSPRRGRLLREPIILEAYFQGLGELNRHRQLFDYFIQLSRGAGLPSTTLNSVRLKAAAFAGHLEAVEALFHGPLADLPAEAKRFWKATAQQAAGRLDDAESSLVGLTASSDPRIANAALRRLSSPVPGVPDDLQRPGVRELLDEISPAVEHEDRFATFGSSRTRRAWATATATAALAVAFAVELRGGSTDVENLIDLGALIIPLSAPSGGWWRIVTAAFLHYGPMHLFLNMVGLMLFGTRLERAWGSFAMALTYLAAAIGSSALVALLSFGASADDPVVMVGASGGVMGLIGAILGFQLFGLLIRRNPLIKREFVLLSGLILLQMVFDATTPNVSSSCHLLGLGIGFLIGLTMGWGVQPKQRKSGRLDGAAGCDSSLNREAAI